MTCSRVCVGNVLQLERVPVLPQPDAQYTSVGIRSFGKGIFHYDRRPGSELGSLRFFELRPDRLVISNIKGWEGAIATSNQSDAGTICSNRFLTYLPVDDQIDIGWACYFFLSDAGLPLIQRASPGSADRNRTLAIDRFEALEIPLPPIEQQRRTAARLDLVIQAINQAHLITDSQKELIGALQSSATQRLDLSAEDRGKAGWRQVQLGDLLAEDLDEVDVVASESYEIAGIYSFGRGLFQRGPLAGSETAYRRLHRLHKRQLVMSRLKAWEGALAVVDGSFDGWYLSPEFRTFSLTRDEIDLGFLDSLVRAKIFWERLGGSSKGIGARKERVSSQRFLDQTIWLPPRSEQGAITRTLEVEQALTWQARHRVVWLAGLRDAALNEAFAALA